MGKIIISHLTIDFGDENYGQETSDVKDISSDQSALQENKMMSFKYEDIMVNN